jgi:hypothetical protein
VAILKLYHNWQLPYSKALLKLKIASGKVPIFPIATPLSWSDRTLNVLKLMMLQ